jgi:hypothetical protein
LVVIVAEMPGRSVLIATTIALLCALAPLAAAAQLSGASLRDLKAQQSDSDALAREAAYTSEVCGRSITARIDWPSTRDWPSGSNLVAACDGALSAVEAICRSGRKTLVRQFVCAGDGSGASLSAGTLRYGAKPGGDGFAETKALLDASK